MYYPRFKFPTDNYLDPDYEVVKVKEQGYYTTHGGQLGPNSKVHNLKNILLMLHSDLLSILNIAGLEPTAVELVYIQPHHDGRLICYPEANEDNEAVIVCLFGSPTVSLNVHNVNGKEILNNNGTHVFVEPGHEHKDENFLKCSQVPIKFSWTNEVGILKNSSIPHSMTNKSDLEANLITISFGSNIDIDKLANALDQYRTDVR